MYWYQQGVVKKWMCSDASHRAWLEKILWGVQKQDKIAEIGIRSRCASLS